jgi:hypothetical protein
LPRASEIVSHIRDSASQSRGASAAPGGEFEDIIY